MIGLPEETEEDLKGIGELAGKIKDYCFDTVKEKGKESFKNKYKHFFLCSQALYSLPMGWHRTQWRSWIGNRSYYKKSLELSMYSTVGAILGQVSLRQFLPEAIDDWVRL